MLENKVFWGFESQNQLTEQLRYSEPFIKYLEGEE